jgi:hypothetical protein
LAQLFFRDIDGDINGRILKRFDQNPRFRSCARAQSDQFDAGSELRRNVSATSIQNIDLVAGDIIFRQFTDLLKQRRAPLIIEVFARDRARIRR